jgi:hypothetical protein
LGHPQQLVLRVAGAGLLAAAGQRIALCPRYGNPAR